MEKVIVAFAGPQNGKRIREILERSGTATCLLCTSADQVRRTVHEQQVPAVVCGYKFADGPAELLYEDLPSYCHMLIVASQSLLDLVQNPEILRLSAPASRSELLSAVEDLLAQVQAQPLRRSQTERDLIARAKAKLMTEGLTEEEAHRALQKKSMAAGVKLAQAARMVLAYR
ncbi:ANTAR domain-containing protein [Flavonifractor sp. AGMB03687]|uniref:ANTAR domain-containing response regulator n=1 Tax=Flavonifractor sp. AGMB03687 TaxID=2785133 RepID=UPI001ADF8E1F|nr:ANTAR domain-containing protein [Flavonifractor sp. AGMB03687]